MDDEGAADKAPAAIEEDPAPRPVMEPEGEYLGTDKLLLFKHWIRPRFLPYRYLTEYRKNYYDDVIDYLDKRNKGIRRDIPVPQTWAERAMRSYTKYYNQIDMFRMNLEDKKLVEESKYSGRFYLHHGKNYIDRRYYSVLY